MIKYSLKCAAGHQFDSWFASADAFDKLQNGGMITCAVCGGDGIEKAIMAPRVQAARDAAIRPAPVDESPPAAAVPAGPTAPPTPASHGPLTGPASPAEQALSELKKQIEANSDYVGKDFVSEARAIHEGEAPDRMIHGEASLGEARKLLDDGVPVAPLPFNTGRKTN